MRETPDFHIGQFVFLDKPPLSNVSDSKAETVARKPYNKIQARTAESFLIVSLQKNTITIDEDGIANTVCIHGVAHAPAITKQTQRATTSVQPEIDSSKDSTPSKAYDKDTDKDEYVFERIVSHIGEGNNFRYVVRWYGYRSTNGTVEPAHHKPQNVIACYRRRVNKKKK